MSTPEPGGRPLAAVTSLTTRRVRRPVSYEFVGDRDAAAQALHELADVKAVLDEFGIGVLEPADYPDAEAYDTAVLEALGESLADRVRRWASRHLPTEEVTP